MADDEDSAAKANGKRPARQETRFRFESVEGQEREARFPDLSRGEIQVGMPTDGPDSISVADNSAHSRVHPIYAERELSSFGIDEHAIRNLAQQFNIRDFSLFRIVLAFAAKESRETADYGTSWRDLSLIGATHEEYVLLCRADASSRELEHVLRELASGAAKHRRDIRSLLTQLPAVKCLLKALDEYGRLLSEFSVIEYRRPKKRPPEGRKRRVVAVLASAWPKLTGEELTPWDARFYQLVERFCRLVGIKAPPSKTSVAGWLKQKSSEYPTKSPSNDE
jgi:hypothetical protein